MPKLKEFEVNLELDIITLKGKWIPSNEEKLASWELYVELITRISVAELRADEGLLREALNSLYSLFDTTRNILKRYGPKLAIPKKAGTLSFGFIAVSILNNVLTPILSKWHPLLLDYENNKPLGVSVLEYEKKWSKADELKGVINDNRKRMIYFSELLANVSGVPNLILKREN